MFTFSIGQMAKLDRSAVERFRVRLTKFLRTEIPEGTDMMSDQDLLNLIDRQTIEANKLNIKSEAGITQFVCLTFAIGDNFQDIPEVANFLQLPSPSTEEKLDELVRILHKVENNGHANALASLLGDD